MKNKINCVDLEGNLGADPKVTYNNSGLAVATMSIAVTEKWEKDGEAKERTDWIPLVCFGKVATSAESLLSKGKRIEVTGKLSTTTWTDKDGNKKSKMEVKVLEFEIKNQQPRQDDISRI